MRYFSVIGDWDSYQCGDAIKQQLVLEDQLSKDLPVVVQVSPSMFCVFGRTTTNTPVGYCHVQVKDNSTKCFSKDCKAVVARAKQHKAKNISLHMHILISLGLINSKSHETTNTPDDPTPGPSNIPSDHHEIPAWLNVNKLTLNLFKTDFMLRGSRQRIAALDVNIEASLANMDVRQVEPDMHEKVT